ncbi:exported hypothetical protein [Tenacibaculum sp. 190524A02b]|uniref:Fibronectin type-III domain-containing protein n=1 Tax=Tenacibaculum vairaonense TaxID=3137860 RepID=A0ABM9PK19_9FLAO
MKTIRYYISVLCILVFSCLTITAQEQHCSFDQTQKEYYDIYPESLDKLRKFERKSKERQKALLKNGYNQKATKYIIPVVFHVYGKEWPITGGQNVDVTEEQVTKALKAINENFKGFNDAVDPSFANLEGGMDIEFKLAQIDPDGNTTNGIIFHETKEGFGLNGTNDAEIAKYAWDNYKYMNVHIQLIIKSGSKVQSGIAWFPDKRMSDEGLARVVHNGRYILYSPPASSLTHEFGHWLGLHHTFNGGCVQGDDKGDLVGDTPPTTAGLASEAGGRSCKTGVRNCFNQLINHQNHMDYNPCESMFTKGQVARMTSFLDHEARKPIWQDNNLTATGTKTDLGPRVLFNYQDWQDSDIDKSLTFLEDFANNGRIQNKKRIKAVGGARFATTGNLQLGTHFTATGVPSGLTPVINVTDTNNAIVSFTGNASNHIESNSTTVRITFLNPAISGGTSSLYSNSGTFKINFLDPYKVHYEVYSPFMHMGYSASNIVGEIHSKFNSLVIGGQLRTKLRVYDGNILTLDNFSQGFEVLCNSNSNNIKYNGENSSISSSSSGTWVKKATIVTASPPVLSSANYTTWRNRTGYIGIRMLTPTNTYVYGWLRAMVSSNGEEGSVTNLALNPDPGKSITSRFERPHLIYSYDRFLEKTTNDNTIENEITVNLNSTTFTKTGALERGKHFTIENVPAGLLLKVTAVNATQARLKMEGVMDGVSNRSDWLAVRDINFKFLNGAFSSGGENVEMKEFSFSIEKVGKSFTGTNITRPTFNIGATQPTGQFTLLSAYSNVSFSSDSYQLQEYPKSNSSNKYPGVKLITWRKDAVANSNYELTPISKGTIIGPNSSWKNGREYHQGRGQHMIDSDSYRAWRGRTAYYGLRIRRSGRMHYGWAKMRVSSNGTQVTVEEYGLNGTPNASIRAGELTSDDVREYCNAGSTFGPDHISRITFSNIDNSSSRGTNGYDNQTDFVVKLTRGKSYTLKVNTTGNSTNELYAWFDWNQDKDFNDSGERVQVTLNNNGDGEININVPTNARLGGSGLRLRVSRSNNNNPCGTSGTGEVEDYGIFISNEDIPSCDDGIKNGDEEKIDCGGSCKPCQVYTEICDAQTNQSSLQITNVKFGTINNTSTHSPYNNFTSQKTNLQKGQATTLTVTLNNNWDPNQVIVWIDWYNDNDFLNTEDVVLQKSGKGPYTASVIPPANAVVNTNLRMRVRAGYTNPPKPCGTDTYIGEVEDYTITVGGAAPDDTQAPSTPTNLVVTNIAQTSLTLNWSASTDNIGVTGYDVYQGSTRIATTNTTSYNVNGLTANTSYTFFIRAKDAAGNTSTPSSTVNATTTSSSDNQAPSAPSNLRTSNITETSLTLNWNASTDNVGVTGYEVYQGSSKLTTINAITYNVTGLSENTSYTFSVRAKDAAGNTSAASNTVNATTNGGDTAPTYCTASTTQSTLYISKVEFGSINNSTSHSPYSNHTNISTNLPNGQATTLTVTLNNNHWTFNAVGVWIDWNNNGDFTDTGEKVYSRFAAGPYSVSITPPNGAVTNKQLRMRVRAGYGTETKITPCGNDTYLGEVEDYTVTVQGSTDTQAPSTPSGLTASNISQTSLNLNWNASTDNVGVTSYRVFRNNSEIGTTSSPSFNITGLTANTSYSFAVSALDQAGNQSALSNTINVTTTGNTNPDDGTVVYVNMNDVTVSSSSTWSPFQLETGDQRYFGPWYSGGAIRLVNYEKNVISEGNSNNVSFITDGITVGASSNFRSETGSFIISSSTYTNWRDKSGYIGFSFKIGGNTHYGWLYATVSNNGNSITFKDYAYNSKAGESLVTKRPSSTSAKTLNTEKVSLNTIQLFPNPFKENITIDVSSIGNTEFSISVYDVLGKELLHKKYTKNPNTILIGEEIEISGSYFIKVKTTEKSEIFNIIKLK